MSPDQPANRRLLWGVEITVLVLIVLVIGLAYRVSSSNSTLDDAKVAATDAKIASQDARQVVHELQDTVDTIIEGSANPSEAFQLTCVLQASAVYTAKLLNEVQQKNFQPNIEIPRIQERCFIFNFVTDATGGP